MQAVFCDINGPHEQYMQVDIIFNYVLHFGQSLKQYTFPVPALPVGNLNRYVPEVQNEKHSYINVYLYIYIYIYCFWGPFMQHHMYFSRNTQNHCHPAKPVIQPLAHVCIFTLHMMYGSSHDMEMNVKQRLQCRPHHASVFQVQSLDLSTPFLEILDTTVGKLRLVMCCPSSLVTAILIPSLASSVLLLFCFCHADKAI